MYARITPYKMKPGTRAAAEARLNTMKDQIMGMKGMKQFINVMNEDGSGYVISLIDSKESSEANTEAVKAAWGKMAEFLETPPAPKGFDVIARW